MKDIRVPAALLVAALLCALPAAAENTRAGDRQGFLVGFGLGFGATYPCDSCPSFAGSFYVGAKATRNLAVIADFAAVGGDVDRPVSDARSSRGRGLGTFVLGIQYWPQERFWLKTGVGIGVPFDTTGEDWDRDLVDRHERSWAGIVGAGYEVTRKGRFVLDLQARGAFASHQQAVSLGLGFNW